jgi:regulator of sirC expression with transglutaminase-like and TPR domain
MGVLEDARRIVAEQMETFEDIVAEARARREHLDADAVTASLEQMVEDAAEEPAGPGPARRRSGNGSARRRA